MKRQTILVTGGCGYIGSHVVRHLSEAGAHVVVLDNLSTGFRQALLHGETLHVADLADQAAVDAVFASQKIDAVIHFAAAVRVDESVVDPVKYYTNNTVNTLRLITTAARQKVGRFVFSSTAAVYGQPKTVPVRETDPVAPESPYGASKLMSERMLQDLAAASGLRYAILRYFNVAGADPESRIGQSTPNASHLIKVACEAAVGKRPGMTLFGEDYPTRDGTCIRDYIHIEDLAAAHLQALEYLEKGGDNLLVNCGYGHGSSVKEVIAAVKEVSGVDFPVLRGARRPGDVAEVVAGIEKIQALLHWTPKYDDLRTIVEHAYRWEKRMAQKK